MCSRFHRLLLVLAVVCLPCRVWADVTTLRIAGAGSVKILPCDGGEGIAQFDLSPIPNGAKIYRAELRLSRSKPVDGRDDTALVEIEVSPVSSTDADGRPRANGEPLELEPPWFDRFDVTDAVTRWIGGKANRGFLVKACPYWDRAATLLNIWYEGEAASMPRQVEGVEVFHREGQTFITFEEIDDRSQDASPSWSDLQARLDSLDAGQTVRYLVFRHKVPINAQNVVPRHRLHLAEQLGPHKVLRVYGLFVPKYEVADGLTSIQTVESGLEVGPGRRRVL
jgi:hypothetical protein